MVAELQKNKMFLFTLVDAYMLFLALWRNEYSETDNPTRNAKDVANSPELLRIRKVFTDHEATLTDDNPLWKIVVALLGEKLDRTKAIQHFLPQLMLFNLRVLDIYDSAMNGMTVEETLDMMKQQQTQAKIPRKEPQSEEDAIKSALGEKMLGQFGKPSFWQHRYDGIAPDFRPHDWYVSWATIRDRVWQFTKLLEPTDGSSTSTSTVAPHLKVLNLGCGNSLVAEALIDDPKAGPHIEKVLSTDFIESVVRAQEARVKNTKYEGKLEFRVLDVLQMDSLPESSFDLVIDKGTMDSLLTTTTAAADFGDACKQISRLLKPGGWLVMLSCAIGYGQIKPLQNLTMFKWRVAHVSEMPSDINLDTKINMLLIQRLTDTELQGAIEAAKAAAPTTSNT